MNSVWIKFISLFLVSKRGVFFFSPQKGLVVRGDLLVNGGFVGNPLFESKVFS